MLGLSDCVQIFGMSALGHKRTFHDATAMSALPPKADISTALKNVR